ncbi:MAG: hypothetical protein H0U50_14395 [Pyrinomonadaceae bacterium]|nr:hypothetical protein [Pyrinomonadaceae bacterium]
MNQSAKNLTKNLRSILLCLAFLIALFTFACKKADRSEGFAILGPSDETPEAAQIVAEANKDLTKIKVLFKENEGKREELKKAMEENNTENVRKLSNEVVQLINDGTASGKNAIEKIQKAQEMEINEEYREYLRLKEESLTRELEAFANYHQAARALRDNYDPKNKVLREKIKEEFKNRSENYRIIMEKARDYSKRANELAKEAQKAKN